MRTRAIRRLLPLLLLTAAGCASQGADAPEYRLLRTAEEAQADGCVEKGHVDVDANEIYADPYGNQAAPTRLAVARLGGNALLILPNEEKKGRMRAATVYGCPAEKVRTRPW